MTNQSGYRIYLTVIVMLFLGLLIDGSAVSGIIAKSQWLTNILTVSVFIWVYQNTTRKLRKLMLYGLGIALAGELVFALALGMYTYRLQNLPIYVPFGHTLVLVSVYYMVNEPRFKRNLNIVVPLLYGAMIVYAAAWLIFANDVFGFICTLVILWALKRRPRTKPFFLVMFFMIVYLELLGTYFQCWSWPPVWFDKINWVPSANPPAGIAVFYFAFDAGCLWIYKHLNPEIWQRLQRLRNNT